MGYGESRGLKSACLRSWVPSIGLRASDSSYSRMHPDSRSHTWSLRVSSSMDESCTLLDAWQNQIRFAMKLGSENACSPPPGPPTK